MRTTFIDTLCEVAALDERIWLLCGDLGYSVLERFAQRFPQRFANMGVAEQNMVGVAAGLALEGKTVFTYSIANFSTLRCLEQIRNDVCYHNLNVKIVAVGGGLAYGAAGYSHHAVEDLAIMRALPNLIVVAPGDPVEVQLATRALAAHSGPAYFRLGKGGEAVVHRAPPAFQLGRAIHLQTGQDLTFITTGGILSEVHQAAAKLQSLGYDIGILSVPTVQPLDTDAILATAAYSRHLISVEEHSITGGLGQSVASVLATADIPRFSLRYAALPNSPVTEAGSQAYLRARFALDSESLAQQALKMLASHT